MAQREIICDYCGKKVKRDIREINRSKKLDRKQYCSRSCHGSDANDADTIIERIGDKRSNGRGAWADEFSPFRYFLHIVRNRKKQEQNISLEYLKQQWEKQNGICPYTGIELTLPKTTRGFDRDDKLSNASLDRIDSDKGYFEGNVQFVCCMANFAKNDCSDNEMKKFCNAIARHWSQ